MRAPRPRTLRLAIGLSAAATMVGLFLQPSGAFAGLLIAGLFGLSLTLGCLLFIAIQGVVGARWWWPIRALPSTVGAQLVIPAAVILAAVMVGARELYPWTRPEYLAEHPLVSNRGAWHDYSFFTVRAALVLTVLLWVGRGLRRALAERKTARGPEGRARFTRWSAAFIVAFALLVGLAWFDWVLSLEPEWFSTMTGVYAFAGVLQAGIAVQALVVSAQGEASADIRHDLGKLLFGFSVFWAYIWFSQYLLIWYSHLPEEVPWFAHRASGGWAPLFWLTVILCFAVPFVALMRATAKRAPRRLAWVALVVLAGRWLDTWVMVSPSLEPSPTVPMWALFATVACVCGVAMGALHRATLAANASGSIS